MKNLFPEHEALIRRFHEHYYYTGWSFGGTWQQTYWMGHQALKCPLDLWVYQEILWEIKPELVIECGTAAGGSTLFLAQMCDLIGKGRVVSIELITQAGVPKHPRITYLSGSTVEDSITLEVRGLAKESTPVLAILDSDHHMNHVLEEMRVYGELVTAGSYLIVEDTNINGHPVLPGVGPGPMEAVEQFLQENPDFFVDQSREKFMMTQNPRGYLRKR